MFKRIKKSLLAVSITVFVMLNTSFAQGNVTTKSDLTWLSNTNRFIAFVMGAIIFAVVALAGVKWGIARVKIGVEDDPAKIAEYESVIKKQIFNLLLALGGSIVTAMLAFFV